MPGGLNMQDRLLELSAGGILALLVIRQVLEFIRNRRNGGRTEDQAALHQLSTVATAMIAQLTSMEQRVLTIAETVKDTNAVTHRTLEMHDVRDADGGYVWWVKSSLEKAINTLAQAAKEQTEVFRDFASELKGTRKDFDRLESHVIAAAKEKA